MDLPQRPLPFRQRSGRTEWLLVGLFCLFGAFRVFVYAAAFPFFSNIDEEFHFDLVCRYSHGDIPRRLVGCSDEAATLISLYRSQEYLAPRDAFLREPSLRQPVWRMTAEEQAKLLPERMRFWTDTMTNHEAMQPPLYYAVVGAWYDLGKLIGLSGGNLLYWTRFFAVPVYGSLIWLSYLLTKQIFPLNAFLYLGVPFVLVFFPQDVFYSLNNDVLSAPLVTLALLLAIRMYRSPAPPGPGDGSGPVGRRGILDEVYKRPGPGHGGHPRRARVPEVLPDGTVCGRPGGRGAAARGIVRAGGLLAGEELRRAGRFGRHRRRAPLLGLEAQAAGAGP